MARTDSAFAPCEPRHCEDQQGSLSALIPEWWEEPTAGVSPPPEEHCMATIHAVKTRAYQGATDLPAIIELALAHKAATSCADRPSIAGLRAQLTAPGRDPHATRLWIDATGALVAFATLGRAEHLLVFIHPGERAPQGRYDALVNDALTWGLAQAAARARRLGAP